MNETIVVAGAGGFAGSRLVRHLLSFGHTNIRAASSHPVDQWLWHSDKVDNASLDLLNPDACGYLVSGATQVYNLAAKVGGVGYMLGANKADCLLSSLINTNLLRACEKFQVGRYFFASSSCVYPDSIDILHEHNARVNDQSYPYSWEKLFSEKMCLAFGAERGIQTRIARYDGLYGPGDGHHGEGRDHAPVALAKKVVRAVQSGIHDIEIWGSGKQLRSFLYIDDAVEGTVRLMNSDCGQPVNIGGAQAATVDEIVDWLESAANVRLRRSYVHPELSGLSRRVTDNTLLRAALNWVPGTPLKDGLTKLYFDVWSRRKSLT